MISLKSNFQVFAIAIVVMVAGTTLATQTETKELFFQTQPQEQLEIPSMSRFIEERRETAQEQSAGKSLSGIFHKLKSMVVEKPYKKALIVALTAGSYALASMTHAAWKENSDKEGLEKIMGILSDLKINGLDRIFSKARTSKTLNHALSSMASEVIVKATKSGLASMARI